MPHSDYHTHTPLCLHAEGEPEEYTQAALKAGLEQYGIADHAPMPDEPFDKWRMTQSQLPIYFEWIHRAKQEAEGTNLEILAGLECDWMPGIEPWISHLKALYDWDYLIGSVHYLDDDKTEFDNPQNMSFWEKISIEAAWQEYWDRYTEMAASGLFNIMAHADLIRKFGHKPEGDLSKYYIPAIEAMAATGSVLEINTSGWHKPGQEQYPSFEFLQLASQAKIPLVINSDAHSPNEVARDFNKAVNIAQKAGFANLVKLHNKSFIEYPLPVSHGY